MLIAEFVTNKQNMSETRTYEDFYSFLGTNPHRMGVVSRMYPHLTATYLLESLKNIFYQDVKGADKHQSINSMYFEWEIEANQIKRVAFAAEPIGDGEGGSEIQMFFTERYYDQNDIFKVDETFQQFFVVTEPTRTRDNYWCYIVRLIDEDYKGKLDRSGTYVGATTRFQSNAFPELSEKGFTKYQSNIARMRNYMTTFRNDIDYSSLYAAHEENFIKISKGDGNGKLSETIYKMDRAKKVLLENHMYAKNSGYLFNRSNIDKNGRPTIVDAQGRPIYIGAGIIPQIEKYASKYAYTKFTIEVLRLILGQMNDKADAPTGNHYMFVVSEPLWNQMQVVLAAHLAAFQTDGTYLYSKAANDYVKVGATFNTYEFGGNKISFRVDRTLTREYGEKGFGVCIDLTADKTANAPALGLFTFKGGEFIQGTLEGLGGLDGLSSGKISSPVAGSKLAVMSYGGVAVFNPYKSFIIREA